ncbi:MAG: type II toxin-antitoxin system HicB family antitoxin [Methanoculleus sp.]|nr:type II toxin-antitoxin system HicB family antitoxin [Methanoculleus sp.]
MIRRAAEGGFRVEVPALPGCYSRGEKDIREAIEGHVDALRREGQSVPLEEDLIVGRVRVAV